MAMPPAKVTSPNDALMVGFKDDLAQIVPYLESLLPGKGAVARFQRMAQFAVLRDQKLLQCTKKSLLLALLWCAQKDLEPGVEDGCWIIPFKNIATPIPAYKGLINKAVQVGAATSVDPVGVYENDDFWYCLGLEPDLKHTPPKLGTPRGELVGAYVTITLPNGEKKFRVLDREQIEKIRNAGAAWRMNPDTGPWADWEEAMFLKTVIKQGLKTVPMSADLRDLLADDNMIEVGSGVGALLASAGTELPKELQGPDDEAEPKKSDTSAFDDLVKAELAGLSEQEAKLRLAHLDENLKITAKNTKKTVPAFKVYAAPLFHPYVNDKKEPREGYWKSFLNWESAKYPPAPPVPVEVLERANARDEEGEGDEDGFEVRNKALVMEILKHPALLADLGLTAINQITPENISEVEGKVKEWVLQVGSRKKT